MTIDTPIPEDISALRRLWQQAFGDSEAFLDHFFSVGFSPERCRCLKTDGDVRAALYWFDCTWQTRKLAYIYAVATDAIFRGKGLGAKLLEDTHKHLQELGYSGAVLVPGSERLRTYYRKFGYADFGGVDTVSISVDALHVIDKQEYARLRRQYLPADSVVQEGTLLDFFARFAAFYVGDGFLLAVTEDGGELLGNISGAAPGNHHVRTPGKTPFAMYLSLGKTKEMPAYFGIALD